MKVWAVFLMLYTASALVVIDSALASSCLYYFKEFDWGCGGTGQGHKMYMCRCFNVDWLGSVSNCMATQGKNQKEVTHAWKHLRTRCLQKAHVDYSVAQIEGWSTNASKYLQAPTAADKKKLVTHPLSVNSTNYAVYRRSFNEINHHVFKSQWFGWGLVLYCGAVIAIFTVLNFFKRVLKVSVVPRSLSTLFLKYMMPDIKVPGFTPFTRFDLLLMVLFTIQAVISTAVSYTVQLPNMYMKGRWFLTMDLIGYRSGIIAFSLMPVVYIFGLRNNPFCFLTGLPQTTFITYHKFVAIIMAIEAMIHTSVWTAYAIKAGPYSVWSADAYWNWGIVGTVLVYIMLFQSIGFIRNFMYELFLAIHKIFGWLFIVLMWYHCISLGWMGWVYSIIAITVYDRIIRCWKIFALNRGFTRVKFNFISENTLAITIPKSDVYDSVYKPGHHLYLNFFHTSIWYKCFQSHPFSVVSSPIQSQDEVTVYMRVKKGVSKCLSKIPTDEKGNFEVWLLIEGPYGHSVQTFNEKESLVGMAGGLGLCSLLPTFYRNPKNSILFWAINKIDDLEALHMELDYLIAQGTDVRVFLKRSDCDESSSFAEEKYKYLSVSNSRPDVNSWVEEAHALASAMGKTDLHILTCGPGLMDSDISASVYQHMSLKDDLAIHFCPKNYMW
ncbi:hypothetical protein PUMCH_003311 [Australozyma saopauloensis]|uniref:FAD-binding FR-type domain-containing protein n=1 Tax=Australozyma saopauloensis TaxID=291208 RepID=A0AAX4HC11_9ASCO|nr:hypothetical protein PUMCH_003311 [[Candida] saopauloensis]